MAIKISELVDLKEDIKREIERLNTQVELIDERIKYKRGD